MKPELFSGIKSKDEIGFVTLNEKAKKDLEKHWCTFITKEDFVYLKSLGINSVRLPIPWWFEGDHPYFKSTPFIHQAMKWASELNIDVLLDLHTAPGCQNGFDNGGIEGVMTWHLFDRNIELTIEKLVLIVKTFKDYPSFMGIELLNEPLTSIDLKIIQDFYKRAYIKIREHTNKLIVMHDAFRPTDSTMHRNYLQLSTYGVCPRYQCCSSGLLQKLLNHLKGLPFFFHKLIRFYGKLYLVYRLLLPRLLIQLLKVTI